MKRGRCVDCLNNKRKTYFSLDRVYDEVKKLAIEKEETYAIYKTGSSLQYATEREARTEGRNIVQLVSKYL